MKTGRMRMLDTAITVLQMELTKLADFSRLDLIEQPSETEAKLFDEMDASDLLDGVDEALCLFAQARNALAEQRDYTVGELTVEVGEAIYADGVPPRSL